MTSGHKSKLLLHSLQSLWIVVMVFTSIRGMSRSIAADESILSDTIKIASGGKHATLDSVTTSYVQINKIYITGNNKTRSTIIMRELMVKEGDVVNPAYLAQVIKLDQQKIFNLHLFNTVNITTTDVDDGIIDLHVAVEERWYFFPVPRFQLSDRNFNEWWQNYNHDFSRVNYGLKLYQYNLWGMNHTLQLKAQFGFERNFQLVYKIPYINKRQKQGLIFEMDYTDGKSVADSTIDHKLHYVKSQDVLRSSKGFGITYTYRKNFYIQHRLKYEYRHTTIADTLFRLNPNYLGNEKTEQQFDALTYEVDFDRRDVAAYPLKGYEFVFGAQQTGIALSRDLQKTSAFIKAAGFKDLGKNFYISALSNFYWSTPGSLPYFNYSTMGYEKTFVRGYEVYVVEGPWFMLNKLTLKKKIFSGNWHLNNWSLKQFNYLPIAVYLKTYADLGYVENYPVYEKAGINNFLADKTLTGVGFGVDVVTGYDVATRFEYTFTPQGNGFFLHFKKEF